ncbi:hypothetical protein I3842_16G077600 [Carya illinoinensis]|uniref:CLAVATA3/ESR (CLE)-related protein 13 n=1 Tax=Carya illinoinensis TaxID=32201 RepID=A0A922A7F3_CARIL|nr:hypothetical protein I3842_16G077600 [Carya illinoinensis]
MALRLFHFFTTILWLFLLPLIFFHGSCFSFNTKNIIMSSSSIDQSLSNRKLMAIKIDFSGLLRHQHRHQHHHHHHRRSHMPVQPGPAGREIDPRYGVEKRLVPTGPNPLHH